jgi:hypothetical protein
MRRQFTKEEWDVIEEGKMVEVEESGGEGKGRK